MDIWKSVLIYLFIFGWLVGSVLSRHRCLPEGNNVLFLVASFPMFFFSLASKSSSHIPWTEIITFTSHAMWSIHMRRCGQKMFSQIHALSPKPQRQKCSKQGGSLWNGLQHPWYLEDRQLRGGDSSINILGKSAPTQMSKLQNTPWFLKIVLPVTLNPPEWGTLSASIFFSYMSWSSAGCLANAKL